jgi:hypothetical protein
MIMTARETDIRETPPITDADPMSAYVPESAKVVELGLMRWSKWPIKRPIAAPEKRDGTNSPEGIALRVRKKEASKREGWKVLCVGREKGRKEGRKTAKCVNSLLVSSCQL